MEPQEALEILKKAAKDLQETPFATPLYTMIGAAVSGNIFEFSSVCRDFAQAEITRMNSSDEVNHSIN